MRVWKLSDLGGLQSMYVAGETPHWIVDRDDVPEDRLIHYMREHPEHTLARHAVPLADGRETFVFAKAVPGDGVIREIQSQELATPWP